MPQTLIPYRPRKRSYATAMLGLARQVRRAYGPINYRSAATKIQRAYRKYATKKKSFKQPSKKIGKPNIAIGPYLGPVPKLTDAKMPKSGVNRFHFEDFGTNYQDPFANEGKQGGVGYLGFTDTGGFAVYVAAAAAIMRATLQKAGIDDPATWNGLLDADLGNCEFYFRAVNHATGTDSPDDYIVALGGQNFNTVCRGLAERLFWESSMNRVLYAIRLYGKDGTDNTHSAPRFYTEHVADSIIDIRIKTNVKFQNVTPADSDPDATGVDMNRNAVNANPLEGHIYRFADPCPKFKESVRNEISVNERQLEITMSSPDDAGAGNGKLHTKSLYGNSGNANRRYLCPPARPKALWSNTTHQSKVYLQPGGYRNLAFVFNFHGTVTRFMENIAANQEISMSTTNDHRRLPKLGSSYMIGLEPSIRTTENEEVKIAYNRDIDIKSSMRFNKAPQLPVRNCVVDDGVSFYTSWG